MQRTILIYILINIINYAEINEGKKNILILYSYSEDYLWTQQIQNGIWKNMDIDERKYNFSVEYMDAKKKSSQTAIEKFDLYFEKKYSVKHFDLILAIDDFAHNYIIDKNKRFFTDTPVISVGVNNLEKKYKYDKANHYLMLEEPNYKENIYLALKQNPDAKKMYLITDLTITGQSIKEKVNTIIDKLDYDFTFEWLDDITYTELKEKIHNVKEDEIIMYYVFFRDNEMRSFTYDQVISKLSKITRNQIYVNWSFYMGTGAFGGDLYDGKVLGEKLLSVSKSILENKKVPMIIDAKQSSNFTFDFDVIKSKEIKLEYPLDSKFYNKSFFFFPINNKIIIKLISYIVLGVGILFVTFAIIL